MKVTTQEIEATLSNRATTYAHLASLLGSMTTQFSTDQGRHLNGSMKRVARAVVKSARTKEEVESAAKLVFGILSKCIGDRTPGPSSRKTIVYHIANQLLGLYMRLGTVGPGQFDSVTRNIVSSGVKFHQYSMSDRVGYRYYLGRYYLSQQAFSRARTHLSWAFKHCTMASPRNKRLILIYLTTASLPLGYFPTLQVLEATDLTIFFAPLIQALKKGDVGRFHQHLRDQDAWFTHYDIALILEFRCDLLLYRSLFRRVFILLRPTVVQKTPNVKLTSLLHAVRFVTRDTSWDQADVENLCVTMIDVGYIRGYIHHVNQILVLDKKKFGFPNVETVSVQVLDHDDDIQFAIQ